MPASADPPVDPDDATQHRWWQGVRMPRLGLRARITLAFTLGALFLSTILAGTTWALTRESILGQRESAVTRQAFRNSEVVQSQLSAGSEDDDLRKVLDSLDNETPSRAVVRDGYGRWTNQSVEFDERAIPTPLLRMAEQGTPGRMRVSIDG
ncbi:MAG TPA: hypothetical protein VNQ33_11455, partial [Acidimicrobiales bacterium]|nr:hypothetical protein [Acidimicrobiales bacterium]